MKKILLAALVATMFASCKKDYTCTCITSQSYTPAASNSFTIEHQSKKDADAACSAKSNTSVVSTYTITVTCTLD